MIKKLPVNERIRLLNSVNIGLQELYQKVASQKLWEHKVSMSDKIELVKEMARTRDQLLIAMLDVYPELTKVGSVNVNNAFITYEVEDVKKGEKNEHK